MEKIQEKGEVVFPMGKEDEGKGDESHASQEEPRKKVNTQDKGATW